MIFPGIKLSVFIHGWSNCVLYVVSHLFASFLAGRVDFVSRVRELEGYLQKQKGNEDTISRGGSQAGDVCLWRFCI